MAKFQLWLIDIVQSMLLLIIKQPNAFAITAFHFITDMNQGVGGERFADYIANGLFSESGFITNYHKQ